MLLVNHALALGTPAIFVIFVVSRGVRAAKPLFYWLECRFVIFAIFVKNPLFLAGQKHPKGPKIEKIQDRPPGLKFSIEIENFKQATQSPPIFGGEF